jgi:hypothetical protein
MNNDVIPASCTMALPGTSVRAASQASPAPKNIAKAVPPRPRTRECQAAVRLPVLSTAA